MLGVKFYCDVHGVIEDTEFDVYSVSVKRTHVNMGDGMEMRTTPEMQTVVCGKCAKEFGVIRMLDAYSSACIERNRPEDCTEVGAPSIPAASASEEAPVKKRKRRTKAEILADRQDSPSTPKGEKDAPSTAVVGSNSVLDAIHSAKGEVAEEGQSGVSLAVESSKDTVGSLDDLFNETPGALEFDDVEDTTSESGDVTAAEEVEAAKEPEVAESLTDLVDNIASTIADKSSSGVAMNDIFADDIDNLDDFFAMSEG